jgi:hypothetical protein
MGSRGQRSMFGKKKKKNDAGENGGAGEKSETTKKASSALPAITSSNGKTNEFATNLRNEIYDNILRGEKLDVTNVMNGATSKRKKIQSVNIEYQQLSSSQRRKLADFLQTHKKYMAMSNGGLGINVSLTSSWPSGMINDVSYELLH